MSLFKNLLSKAYPYRLRNQLILMAIIMVTIPTLSIGYVVGTEGRAAVIAEKEKKLLAITHLLDEALASHFSDYAILPRNERIIALNHELSPLTEKIASAFPGTGIGYYHKQLDAIITYAPKSQYQNNVGQAISQQHPGRFVMESGQPRVYSGKQVRGDILNSMYPVKRHGEVTGYIWANELSEDIRQQTNKMDLHIIIILITGLLISLLLIIIFSHRLSTNIDVITKGLEGLAQNLQTRLPDLPGEIGQISHSVNSLAQVLLETKTLNDLIIENAADGVVTIDKDGYVTTMNPAAEKITGYQQENLLGHPYNTLFTGTHFFSPVLDTLQSGMGHVALEIRFPARNRIIELSVTTSQIHNSHGELIGALVIFSDLTARKEVQRRFAQTERLATLGELMASVAHEVRNPLTAIRGYVQILKQQVHQAHHQEYLSIVLKEIDAINRVIQQLLDFSRPRQSQWQQVKLNQLIQETLILVKTTGLQTRIDFTLQLTDDLPEMIADPELLKQVFLNIMINAVQAIANRGNIIIRSWQYNDSHQAVMIQDDGVGIAPQNLQRIFDPFFTTKTTGTGLGLALSQRIINIHHGDIQLTSEPGKGTSFTVILPVQPQHSNKP